MLKFKTPVTAHVRFRPSPCRKSPVDLYMVLDIESGKPLSRSEILHELSGAAQDMAEDEYKGMDAPAFCRTLAEARPDWDVTLRMRPEGIGLDVSEGSVATDGFELYHVQDGTQFERETYGTPA